MTDREREYYNTYVRVRDFGEENTTDFPAGSQGATNFGVMATEVPKVKASGALQESNIGKQATVSKESAAAEVLEDMRAINRTARAIGVDSPDIAVLFRMPQGSNYQTLLAAAMAFRDNAQPMKGQFIAYGLPDDFLTDLQSNIDALAGAISQQNLAKDTQTGATGAVAASLKLMNEALRRLRGIVPNVYQNNAAKLAAWASASHVERPAQNKPQPAKPTP